VRQLGFKGKKLTLHSFRHTYAIRRITITGRMDDVMREMGHGTPASTLRYLRFSLQRRLDDFPSLKHKLENKSVLGNDGHDLMDTRAYLTASS
tara:strand:- start:18 stop:296 length:279 start_codon:yes stop_codon:yes gene_type:complete